MVNRFVNIDFCEFVLLSETSRGIFPAHQGIDMGAFSSRQNAGVEEADVVSNHAYKYPPRSGMSFIFFFVCYKYITTTKTHGDRS